MSVSPFQWLRAIARRLDFHLNRDRYARELSDEMALHLELASRLSPGRLSRSSISSSLKWTIADSTFG